MLLAKQIYIQAIFEHDRKCLYKHYNEARSCNYCCGGKAISITYPECVFVALGIHHAMRVRRIVICGLNAALRYFSAFFDKRSGFRSQDIQGYYKINRHFQCLTYWESFLKVSVMSRALTWCWRHEKMPGKKFSSFAQLRKLCVHYGNGFGTAWRWKCLFLL